MNKKKNKLVKIEYSEKINQKLETSLSKIIKLAKKARETFKDEDFIPVKPCL